MFLGTEFDAVMTVNDAITEEEKKIRTEVADREKNIARLKNGDDYGIVETVNLSKGENFSKGQERIAKLIAHETHMLKHAKEDLESFSSKTG